MTLPDTPYWREYYCRKDAGLCPNDGNPVEPGRKKCRTCLDRFKHYAEERLRKRRERGLCSYCNNPAKPGTIRCERCLERARTYDYRRKPKLKIKSKRYRENMRQDVFQHYGNVCACCGELEEAFLCMDHVNGGGTKERKEIGGSSDSFYRRIRNEGYPPDYQILCANCNMAKSTRGLCPHRKELAI